MREGKNGGRLRGRRAGGRRGGARGRQAESSGRGGEPGRRARGVVAFLHPQGQAQPPVNPAGPSLGRVGRARGGRCATGGKPGSISGGGRRRRPPLSRAALSTFPRSSLSPAPYARLLLAALLALRDALVLADGHGGGRLRGWEACDERGREWCGSEQGRAGAAVGRECRSQAGGREGGRHGRLVTPGRAPHRAQARPGHACCACVWAGRAWARRVARPPGRPPPLSIGGGGGGGFKSPARRPRRETKGSPTHATTRNG